MTQFTWLGWREAEKEAAKPRNPDSCDHSLFVQELFDGEVGPDSLHLAVRRHNAGLRGGILVIKHQSSAFLLLHRVLWANKNVLSIW